MAEEPGHYGKLDHTGKKKTATLHVDNSEYGKLDWLKTNSPQHCSSYQSMCTVLLSQSQKHEDSDHYGKLDHTGKKKTATLPVDNSEYGKLDWLKTNSPQHCSSYQSMCTVLLSQSQKHEDSDHYGKLDHTGKKKTATLPVDNSEYGKLDWLKTNSPQHCSSYQSMCTVLLSQSQKHEDSDHYGKLDHTGKKKTATLPVDSSEYGKLDRVYTYYNTVLSYTQYTTVHYNAVCVV